MPFKMVLWCNGSTRDFGSLRDCSIQSGTTQFIFYINFIYTCMTACESSGTKKLNLHLFGCLFLFSINFYISTACDKSLSYAIKAIR